MHRGSNCPLARAMDGRIMRCGTTGSCHFQDCKVLLVTSRVKNPGFFGFYWVFCGFFISMCSEVK